MFERNSLVWVQISQLNTQHMDGFTSKKSLIHSCQTSEWLITNRIFLAAINQEMLS